MGATNAGRGCGICVERIDCVGCGCAKAVKSTANARLLFYYSGFTNQQHPINRVQKISWPGQHFDRRSLKVYSYEISFP